MKRAYLIIAVSFAFLMLGAMAVNAIATSLGDKSKEQQFANVAVPAVLLGFAGLFLWGTGTWAAAKGYPAVLGIFLGWLGPLGLLILVSLAIRVDRRVNQPAQQP
jgi:hypothetical protein